MLTDAQLTNQLDSGPNVTTLRPKANGHPGYADLPQYRPLLATEMPPPVQPRLIAKLVAEASLTLIYGDWGSGKSFLAVDLACHVAANRPWRGRAVLAGVVVYIAAEAGRSIASRVQAWSLRHGVAAIPLGIVAASPDLLSGDGLDDAIAEAQVFAGRFGSPLRLVVVDTVHAAAPGSDESARDVGRILASVRRIVPETSAAVILVHHSGKDAARGARGSNSLEAGMDLVLEVREEPAYRTVLVRKVRDGEAPELEPFIIETVTLSHAEGEPITAGVAVTVEPQPITPTDPRREEVRRRQASGESVRCIANAMGIGKSTVQRWLS
jgi:DNA-binding NarL/FixJ family response regulator